MPIKARRNMVVMYSTLLAKLKLVQRKDLGNPRLARPAK